MTQHDVTEKCIVEKIANFPQNLIKTLNLRGKVLEGLHRYLQSFLSYRENPEEEGRGRPPTPSGRGCVRTFSRRWQIV